jgi:predicted ATPase
VPEWRGEHPAGPNDSPVVLAEAVLRLLVSVGGSRGCLLVLEDLHDADADTLAVVEYLVDNAGAERVLVLGTARTGSSPAQALVRSARHRRVAGVVELERLDDEAVRHLAAACLGVEADQVPAPVLDRLVETADGVPLHVEELLAGLVSERVLVRVDGGWVLTGPVPSSLPVSLAATLAARAERLGPESAALLGAAALLGRRFPAEAAGAAAGIDGERLRACLRSAVDAQLLVPGEEINLYAFRHTLTAEALRARLLRSTGPPSRAGPRSHWTRRCRDRGPSNSAAICGVSPASRCGRRATGAPPAAGPCARAPSGPASTCWSVRCRLWTPPRSSWRPT